MIIAKRCGFNFARLKIENEKTAAFKYPKKVTLNFLAWTSSLLRIMWLRFSS